MAEGCPRCGKGTEANPHRPGWFWLILHEVTCWGPRVALYNAAWLWTHETEDDD
jgi:hypothetical protein